jgi:hypothetical protein
LDGIFEIQGVISAFGADAGRRANGFIWSN